jgi:hypothetical protein
MQTVRCTASPPVTARSLSRGGDHLDGPTYREYQQRELVVRDLNGLILAFGEATTQSS